MRNVTRVSARQDGLTAIITHITHAQQLELSRHLVMSNLDPILL